MTNRVDLVQKKKKGILYNILRKGLNQRVRIIPRYIIYNLILLRPTLRDE